VTAADRRLAALAAAWAGARAAGRLAAAPRHERLRTLAAEIAPDPRVVRARAEAAASQERAAVARLLAAVPCGAGRGRGAPPLVRLCREATSP